MSVFPNPVRDQVRIAFGQPVYGRVSMMDSTGRPIASFDLDGATEKDIPTAHLPAGMYILRFEGRDGHTAQQKLMVN
jgi:hypothetical protein